MCRLTAALHPVTVLGPRCVVLAFGWVVSLLAMYYAAFGPNYAMPPDDATDQTVCGWGGSFDNGHPSTNTTSATLPTRTHSIHDLLFSVCFRTWWALSIAWIVWASMADQGGIIGAFLGRCEAVKLSGS
eukprot:SAG31_NODE_9032_length_1345_cov_1.495185_2_plen_129_part_00